jgi:FG-GAP-like repeat/IPT/TIG domain
MRTRLAVAFLPLLLAVFCPPLAAQNNPVPFVNNPLAPASAVPGAAGFTLTVNGGGFVSGAVVNWNGNARATTFISNTQLTAVIPASDLTTAATIPVTVSNPAPGGGASNAALFEVTTPTATLAFNRTDTNFSIFFSGDPAINQPSSLAVAYFPRASIPNLVIASTGCPARSSCILDHGYISNVGPTFGLALTVAAPNSVVAGDFNGDGSYDLLSLGNTYSVSLAHSTNTFIFDNPKDYPLPVDTNPYITPMVGDFNRDGRLDLMVAAFTGVYFVPGNGDGTFGTPVFIATDPTGVGTQIVGGDFNGDGNLDLAVSNFDFAGSYLSVLLGNGDGTFLPQPNYPLNLFPGQIAAADFNGDGKIDLAQLDSDNSSHSISILLGNGDGTFQPRVDYPAGTSPFAVSLGDYNGDGQVDLAITDSLCLNSGCPANGAVNVLLGNGDGTFQSHLDFAAPGLSAAIASAEFSYFTPVVGREGFAISNSSASTVSIFTGIGTQTGPTNPLPTISSVAPPYVIQNSGAFTMTITGTNFVTGAAVTIDGQAVATTFVSSTQLTAQIPVTATANVGALVIDVNNPVPGGGNSTSRGFPVYYAAPLISSISTPSAVAGSPGFSLTISGSNFVQHSTLDFNGVVQPFTFVSSTQLTTTVPTSAIATPGAIAITLTNPELGVDFSSGGTSPAVSLTILPSNTQPTVGGLSPASATVGGPAFTLTIIGTGFGPTSTVTFGSATVSSAYTNSTTLQASIPASAIAVAGTPLVSVQNPGGNPSVVISFTVNNPAPALTSLSPTSAPPGSAALTLNITGANFNPSSVVHAGSTALSTTVVSSTTLTAVLPAANITPGATIAITVNNPSPGGGTTSALSFSVADFNVTPATSTSAVAAGQPASFTLAVAPANGSLGGPVTFSTSPLPPNATATFSPSSLPAGTTSTAVTLAISTTPHTAASAPLFPRPVWPLPSFLCAMAFVAGLICLGCWVLSVPARRFAPQILVVLLLVMACGLAACGGASGNLSPRLNPSTGTPAGTYPIIVTAVSGNAAIATTVTLTVN